MSNSSLYIDTSNLNRLLNNMREVLNEKQFYQAQYHALKRAGKSARTIVKNDVRVDYAVPAGYVLGSMSAPRLSSGGGGVSCVIDIANTRGRIGPIFKAKGGRTAKRYKRGRPVGAQVYTASTSLLPTIQTDRPHFRTSKGVYVRMVGSGYYTATVRYKTKHGMRTYRARKEKIRPGVGISVPQMPLNRSEPKVQQHVEELLEKRLIHECKRLLDML